MKVVRLRKRLRLGFERLIPHLDTLYPQAYIGVMKKLIIALLILALPVTAQAKRLYLEKEYQKEWCSSHGGIVEYVLPDKSRVDCLTDTHAIEFNFASKQAEAIGQALFYAEITGRLPGVVLILGNPDKDTKYLKRLLTATKGLDNFSIWVIEPESIGVKWD